MPFLLTSDHHHDISLSEDQAAYLLRSNGLRKSKLTSMKEYGETALLQSGAVMKWGNNA